jgi:hypothetical protein
MGGNILQLVEIYFSEEIKKILELEKEELMARLIRIYVIN